MYSVRDLKVIDPIEEVRRRPEFYLGSKEPTVDLLVGRLACDVACINGRVAYVTTQDDWWIVGSDLDWISLQDSSSLHDFFHSIIAFPESGPNSFHAEVLLVAFAEDVVTFDRNTATKIQGNADFDCAYFRSKHPKWNRSVAFRLATTADGGQGQSPKSDDVGLDQ